jgi:hypothetical protein
MYQSVREEIDTPIVSLFTQQGNGCIAHVNHSALDTREASATHELIP